MSTMVNVIVILGLIGLFIGVWLLVSKKRAQGKTLITIINKDKSTTEYILNLMYNKLRVKNKNGKDETYIADTSKVMSRLYPSFGPKILRNEIPWLIYTRNNPDPLDPSDVTSPPKGRTAREITCMTDESVVEGLAKNADIETKKKDKLLIIAIGILGLILIAVGVMVFFNMKEINSIKALIGG